MTIRHCNCHILRKKTRVFNVENWSGSNCERENGILCGFNQAGQGAQGWSGGGMFKRRRKVLKGKGKHYLTKLCNTLLTF